MPDAADTSAFKTESSRSYADGMHMSFDELRTRTLWGHFEDTASTRPMQCEPDDGTLMLSTGGPQAPSRCCSSTT
jgi:hypothetical protein